MYIGYTSKEAVFAERYDRTLRDLIEELILKEGNTNWIDELPKVAKKYNNDIHSSTNMTAIKSNEKEVYNNIRDECKKESQILK